MSVSLSDITSLLTAASGPAGDVGALATFGTTLIKAFQPSITDDEIQKFNDQFQSDMRDLANAVTKWQAAPNDPGVDSAWGSYALGVFSDAGYPFSGGMAAGPLVGVRLGFVVAALSAALALKYQRAQSTENAADQSTQSTNAVPK